MPASWWLAGHCVHKMQKGAALGALSLPCKICFILTNKLKERAPIKLFHVVILSTQMSDRSLGASAVPRHCSEAESPKRDHAALAPIHSFPVPTRRSSRIARPNPPSVARSHRRATRCDPTGTNRTGLHRSTDDEARHAARAPAAPSADRGHRASPRARAAGLAD